MDRPRVARELIGWACGPLQSIRPLVGACAPAIMEIRAQLSSLDPRPRGPCAGPDFSCAGETIVPSFSPLSRTSAGKLPIYFWLAATVVMPLLAYVASYPRAL